MSMTFNDKASFDAAQSKWKWVDEKDINHFILITEMDQCYKGDDRSPYLVNGVTWDEATLTAKVDGAEQPWKDVVSTGHLKINSEYVDPSKANVTHPQLIRRDGKKLSLNYDKSFTLFDYKKDSKESAGLGIKANVHLQTGGAIMTDLDVEFKKILGVPTIPKGIKADMKPQGLWGSILLGLELDGKLGKPIDFAGAEIDIPVAGFSIAKIISVGPMASIGVHFGSTAIEGTAQVSVGTKAKIPDNSVAHYESSDKNKNKLDGWKPEFEKLDPRFTAEVKAGMKAWAELSFKVKASALDFGFEAGIAAQIPYIEANLAVKADTKAGVCGSKKAVGVEVSCEAGINVDLEMDVGKLDNNPVWDKNLYHTQWDLFKTCVGFGKDIQTSSVAAVPAGPGKTKSDSPASNTAKPTSGSAKPTTAASKTDKPSSAAASGTAKPSSAAATGTAKPSSAAASGTAKPSSAAASGTAKPSSAAASGTAKLSSAAASGTAKPSSAAASGTAKPSSAAASGTAKPSSAAASGTAKPSSAAVSGTAKPSSAVSVKPSSAAVSGTAKPSSAYASVKPSSAAASGSAKPSSASSGAAKPSGSATGSAAAPSATGGSGGGAAGAISYLPVPTLPKFEGAIASCTKWYEVKAGENCSASGLATPDLCKLNKGLEASCANLLSGVAYCVGA
jgi:hypothetical protein